MTGREKSSQRRAPQGKDRRLKSDCFLYGGPHWSRDYPKKNAFHALLGEKQEEKEPARMGSIKLLGALKAKSTTHKVGGRALMYVEGVVNGKTIPTVVDTRAPDKFIQPSEVARLGLKAKETKGWLKTVNFKATALDKVAKDVGV
ncbi:hypothetical protein QQ045_031356 [Rhodiola kirilowii]